MTGTWRKRKGWFEEYFDCLIDHTSHLRPSPGVRIIICVLLSNRLDVCVFVRLSTEFHSIVWNARITENKYYSIARPTGTIWISKGWFVKHKRKISNRSFVSFVLADTKTERIIHKFRIILDQPVNCRVSSSSQY